MELSNIVSTVFGKVQGYKEREICIFKGIPYASPPVIHRRFLPPFPPKPWKDVRRFVEFGPISPQIPYLFTHHL